MAFSGNKLISLPEGYFQVAHQPFIDTGDAISVYGTTGPDHGAFTVQIDGQKHTLNASASQPHSQTLLVSHSCNRLLILRLILPSPVLCRWIGPRRSQLGTDEQ